MCCYLPEKKPQKIWALKVEVVASSALIVIFKQSSVYFKKDVKDESQIYESHNKLCKIRTAYDDELERTRAAHISLFDVRREIGKGMIEDNYREQ